MDQKTVYFVAGRIDINQCPPGRGNNGPNAFAGTAKCKKGDNQSIYCMSTFDSLPTSVAVDLATAYPMLYVISKTLYKAPYR